MKRHQFILGGLGLLLSLWAVVFFDFVPLPLDPRVRLVIDAFPFYALMVFGCYALFSIGSDLISFEDISQSAIELRKDMDEAREDLKRRGYREPPAPADKKKD